ncbi:hypothetical protein ACPF8X_35315, partial [Streptomyces sp. G35A]
MGVERADLAGPSSSPRTLVLDERRVVVRCGAAHDALVRDASRARPTGAARSSAGRRPRGADPPVARARPG